MSKSLLLAKTLHPRFHTLFEFPQSRYDNRHRNNPTLWICEEPVWVCRSRFQAHIPRCGIESPCDHSPKNATLLLAHIKFSHVFRNRLLLCKLMSQGLMGPIKIDIRPQQRISCEIANFAPIRRLWGLMGHLLAKNGFPASVAVMHVFFGKCDIKNARSDEIFSPQEIQKPLREKPPPLSETLERRNFR